MLFAKVKKKNWGAQKIVKVLVEQLLDKQDKIFTCELCALMFFGFCYHGDNASYALL